MLLLLSWTGIVLNYTETEACSIHLTSSACNKHITTTEHPLHTSSVSSILKAIFPMLSPTRLKSRITPALDRAEVLVARGRSPSTSRKSTKLGSVCRSGWAATLLMNLYNNDYLQYIVCALWSTKHDCCRTCHAFTRHL